MKMYKKKHRKHKKHTREDKKPEYVAGFNKQRVPPPIKQCNDVMLTEGKLILNLNNIMEESSMAL